MVFPVFLFLLLIDQDVSSQLFFFKNCFKVENKISLMNMCTGGKMFVLLLFDDVIYNTN